jgi:3'-phosphoadenosine 5'-phosphosulfate sulfotransferase (PAPS reductase)/FAD synthetase
MSRVALAVSGFGPPLFPEEMLTTAIGIIDRAVTEHKITKVFGLLSGGHDSTTAVSVASQHPAFAGAVHLNTGVGLAKTREFVIETCKREGWPLIEIQPQGEDYASLVRKHGFPAGPKSHNRMYYQLKQRSLRRLVRDQKTHRHDRIGLVTGVRMQESSRRMAAAISVEIRRIGCQVWINDILSWTKDDTHAYMAWKGMERNLVVDLIHRSGECCCGALASAKEWPEIAYWFPTDPTVELIHGLQDELGAAGVRDCKWATRPPKAKPEVLSDQWGDLPMCVGCMKGAA